MNIRILGAHRCESESTRCVSLLIDDALAIDAGGLTSSLSISAQVGLKAILLTHQHYDHIRDVPMLAMNLFLQGTGIRVYSSADVRDDIEAHLLNGILYPKFQEIPEAKPTVSFNLIVPYQPERLIEGYRVLAIPVNHGDTAFGYQVSSANGQAIFYTGDTGPGLSDCCKHVSPQTIITEVTVPNRYEGFATRTGHLTPNLLGRELSKFRELRGYLPRIIIAHMDPNMEKEIEEEITGIAEAIGNSIIIAHEGMQFHL